MHEKMGMHGELIVGRGGAPAVESPAPGQHLYDGTGTVISVDPRKGRVVLDHKEIPGFMAAMASMSFRVTPSSLLEGLHPSEAVRFTIDADQRVIVNIVPVPALPAPAQQR